jgi:hypothetical protein
MSRMRRINLRLLLGVLALLLAAPMQGHAQTEPAEAVDLVVSALSPPASAETGTGVAVANTVTNQGSGKSVTSYLRFYLSTDATITTADTYLGQRSVTALNGGSSSSATTTLTIPASVAPGSYYIGAIADATDTNPESDETNNTAAAPITLTSGVDLVVSALSGPASAEAGEGVAVANTVTNQGSGKSVSSSVRFYLSTDATITSADRYLGQRSVSALDAAASSSATTNLTIPATVAPGSYYIGAIADATDTNRESDETNNTAATPITVRGVDEETYTVTASAGAGGAISPSSQSVNSGSTATFTVTPDTGYSITSVAGCNGALEGTTYTTGAITADCAVNANFGINSYTVTASAGTGGSISPPSASVDHGSTTSFAITPDTGYSIANVTGCGGSLTGNHYTTGIITAACTVSASFAVSLTAPQNVVATAGNGEVALAWTAVTGATGYNVYWSEMAWIHPNVVSSYLAMASVPTSSHTVTGLANDTLYYFIVTATASSAESAASEEISATPVEPAAATGALNDTGVQSCAEALTGNNTPCTGSEPAGQDAHYGRDAAAAAGTLMKIGGGSAGFDFTKIANNGSELPETATLGSGPSDWACTRDNVTGLIWEVKVEDSSHSRHLHHTYTWYDTDSPDGDPGSSGGTSSCRNTLGGQYCNTANYTAAVNAAGLCGRSDWRMPTVKELEGIVNFGRHGPVIDSSYFPNTVGAYFWSGTPGARSTPWDSGGTWGLSFNSGHASYGNRSWDWRVRLVRGR